MADAEPDLFPVWCEDCATGFPFATAMARDVWLADHVGRHPSHLVVLQHDRTRPPDPDVRVIVPSEWGLVLLVDKVGVAELLTPMNRGDAVHALYRIADQLSGAATAEDRPPVRVQ